MTCPGPEAALALVGAARRLRIAAKAREVRGVDRVVVRDGDAIGALLTRLGAHDSVLAWEERRMRREVRATANRLANFDDANLRRTARAAVAAGARVQRALEILADDVPEHLAAAGRLRMEHKQASLEELGALADPPLTKDAVAGRIRRLLAMADGGAYTGEISGPMLAKLKCTYVAVGHSERRQYHGETDELVNAKVKAAYKHGITPILCVGEELAVREAGNHVAHTLAQVEGGLKDVPAEQAESVVIAYEPVWAIGTGKVCGAEDAQEVCSAVRGKLAELYSQEVADQVRIQYGGSVKSGNVAEIMAQADIDGALVGGASLDADEFVKIIRFRDQ
ncbi:Triosephosphate isomerase [Streptomyces hirsutus]